MKNNKEKLNKIKKILEKAHKSFKGSKYRITKSEVYFPHENKRQQFDKLEHNFLVSIDAIQKIEEVIKK